MMDIKEKAEKLLDDYGLLTSPIDLTMLARKLNIAVQYEDLDSDISGFLVIKEKKKSTIVLNKKHSKNRQRFTFSHEIGHYVLHRDSGEELFLEKELTYFRSEQYSEDSKMEKEANQFAAYLLMPEKVIKELISTNNFDISKERDFSKLSKILQVSERALAIHLVELKYLHY